jgi:ATP-dependent helicase/nuclease subunit B
MDYSIPPSDNFFESAAQIIQSLQKENPGKEYNVILPNKRSCRELKKYLPKTHTSLLPKLTTISDLFSFEDITLPLTKLLKDERQSIPLNTLYELAESLSFLIKELTLNNVHLDQLISAVPENLQKYWNHTIAAVGAAMEAFEIKKSINIIQERLNTFLMKTENIVTAGLGEVNLYAKLLLQKAQSHGTVISHLRSDTICAKAVEFQEFNSIFEEGQCVAIAVRKAVFEEKSILIVSPDQSLTEIIKSELKRWNIFIDDSRGVLFSKTFDGLLISSILDMMEKQYSTVSVLNVLHISPIFSTIASKLELFLRRQRYVPTIFSEALKLYPDKDVELSSLTKKIMEISADACSIKSFSAWFETCHQLTFIFNPESVDHLHNISSRFLQDYFLALKITLKEFSVFFKNHVISQPLRRARGYTPNVVILGAIEAQLLDADLVIITSANEESWVKSFEKNDFWLAQSLQEHFGMQSVKMKNDFLRNIFERLVQKKNVLITRSTLVDGAEQQKYEYFKKIAESLEIKNASWLSELALGIEKSCQSELIKFKEPNPELNLRPQRFWVSDLDLLVCNPYAFYAKKILGLSELPHPNELKNIRGNYIHAVLEKFIKNLKGAPSLTELQRAAREVLKDKWLDPSDFGLWFFRLDKIFSFIINNIEAKKHFAEISGSCSIKITENYEASVSCRADRIDVDEDGISIVDYKSGHAPTEAQVYKGDKKQLLIAAIIAQNGGFGLTEMMVKNLCYWELIDSKIVSIASDGEKVLQGSADALEWLKNLIYKFNVGRESYKINADASYDESYLHLARVKEWLNV